MNKEKKRRPEGGQGWDDAPRRLNGKERFVEKRQNWQDYLELSEDEEGAADRADSDADEDESDSVQ